jgi:predicted thioredoxin/glutaredoxin
VRFITGGCFDESSGKTEISPVPRVVVDCKELGIVDYMEFKSIMESLGITDRDFIIGIHGQLMSADSIDGNGLEFAVSVIKGIKPRDQLEVMSAAEMAVFHMSTMKFLRRLGEARGTTLEESAQRIVTKLSRAFTDQMGALKRYRTGGEQKIVVQHVSVSDGGQAIVGTVNQSALENSADKTIALTDASQPAIPIVGAPEGAPVAVRRRQKHDGR